MSTMLTWQPFTRPALRASANARTQLGWMPHAEVSRDEDATVLRLEVPGVRPDDLEVCIEDDVLTIRGRRGSNGTDVRFERRFTLPGDADTDGISASHDLGVLELRIPHVAPARRTIPINMRSADHDGGEREAIEAEAKAKAN